ncbi:hypothetical protein Nmel_006090 [Mimus melanotis]
MSSKPHLRISSKSVGSTKQTNQETSRCIYCPINLVPLPSLAHTGSTQRYIPVLGKEHGCEPCWGKVTKWLPTPALQPSQHGKRVLEMQRSYCQFWVYFSFLRRTGTLFSVQGFAFRQPEAY